MGDSCDHKQESTALRSYECCFLSVCMHIYTNNSLRWCDLFCESPLNVGLSHSSRPSCKCLLPHQFAWSFFYRSHSSAHGASCTVVCCMLGWEIAALDTTGLSTNRLGTRSSE